VHPRIATYFGILGFLFLSFTSYSQSRRIIKKEEIRDGISPKSIVTNGNGLFSAQNMMYRHTITVYGANGNRKAKIRDEVNLNDFGYSEYGRSSFKGAPVEAVFTKDGKYLWVSNYNMVGEGFDNPGCDACHGDEFDPSFLYKIDMSSFEIVGVVKVGSVPKFLAISEDQNILVVSNWSSGDVSIVDLSTEKEVKRIRVGPHPRGVDITEDSKTAFITVMGSTKIAEINLQTYETSYIKDIGRSPRSLILSDSDSTFYVSLNSGSSVIKYNRYTKEKVKCRTASGPRSMCLSPQGDYLYVVNYFDNSFSKIQTKNMEVAEKVKTSEKPIGICANWEASEIWVACYSGRIEIFKDFHLDSLRNGNSILGFDLSSFWAFTHSTVKDDNSNKTITDLTIKDDEEVDEFEEIEVVVPIENPEVYSKIIPKTTVLEIDGKRFPDIPDILKECHYHVIAGSFSVMENAENRKSELKGKGYSAIVIEGALNYVSASCYESKTAAEKGMHEIKSATGYSAWILKR
jgi:YVTN family beta-propeller protein